MKAPSLFFAMLFFGIATVSHAFDHTHTGLHEVLQARVDDRGLVDYAGLKADRAGLDAYIAETSAVSQADFDQWTEPQQIAFLINVYNAETLELIIDHYPVSSIKKIGGLLSSPWDKKSVVLFGEKTTLNYVEHELLRKNYDEPRIHFAIVCAAFGCPPLDNQAFVAETLDTHLTERGEFFLGEKQKNYIENDTLYLSPIFNWFKGDFTKDGTLQEWVDPYFAENVSQKSVQFTDYDWSLNQQ